MFETPSISAQIGGRATSIERLPAELRARLEAVPEAGPRDLVEVSEAARSYEEQAPATVVRDPLVTRVRMEIERGEYLTAEKIDVAIERLHRELFGRN